MYAFEKPYTLDIGKYFCLAKDCKTRMERISMAGSFFNLIQDGIFTKLWVGFGAFLKMKIPFGLLIIAAGFGLAVIIPSLL